VEFALVSLILYVLLAVSVEFGRLMFSAQALQEIARLAARELALTPLPPAIPFDGPGGALDYVDPVSGIAPVKARIFDQSLLVINLDSFATDAELDAHFASLPVVNRALRPLMIIDHTNDLNLLRYPGALLTDPAAPSGYTVGIPQVSYDGGMETVTWVSVVEEIRTDPGDPTTGPFSLVGTLPERGTVAVRINYPYQAAMLTGFRSNSSGPFEPNLSNPIAADDTAVQQNNVPPGGLLGDPEGCSDSTSVVEIDCIGPYAGPFGLGRQLAFGSTVRPFRKLISAQAIYRREVFQ
jgi:hypothetical protein